MYQFSSLKNRFASYIAVLITVVLLVIASFLISLQSSQIKHQIYQNARSFMELSADDIVESFENFFLSQNDLFFQRDIRQLLSQNSDIANISVFNFEGTGLYSHFDNFQPTSVSLQRLQSALPTALLEDGTVVYIQKDAPGVYSYVNQNHQVIDFELKSQSIQNFSFPVAPKYNIVFDISYQNLAQRVFESTMLIIFGLLLALATSIYLAFYMASKVTNPIAELSKVVDKIAEGKLSVKAKYKSLDEVGQLATNVNRMALDLKKATAAKVYQARVTKELELAGTIQKRLLPMSLPKIDGLDVAGQVNSAEEIGGDIYDVIQDSKGNYFLYVGDVTGHGVPAGILASVSNALLLNNVENGDLVEITDKLNEILVKKSSPNLFITLALLKYTLKKKLSYISAGHEQIIHYQKDTDTTVLLESGGIAAGLFAGIRPKLVERKINAKPGDVLALYSDGIPEAWLNKTDQYGFERLQRTLKSAAKKCKTADAIKNQILTDVTNSIQDMPQADDITLLVIKIT